MIKPFLSLIFIFCIALTLSGQDIQTIKSLKQKLNVSQHDTDLVLILADLSFELRNSRPDTALILSEQAINLAKKIRFLRGQSRALHTMASVYWIKGDIPAAIEASFSALEIAENNGFHLEESRALNILGILTIASGDTSRGMQYFQQALLQIKRSEDMKEAAFFEAVIEGNLGYIFKNLNLLDSSLFHLQKGYSIIQRNHLSQVSSVYILSQLSAVLFLKGDTSLARSFRNQAKAIAELNNDYRVAGVVYNTLAGQFHSLGQTDSAIYYAEKGLAVAQSIGFKSSEFNNSTLLSEIYESIDYRQAFKFQKIAIAANDEINGTKKVQALLQTISREQQRKREIEAKAVATRNTQKQIMLIGGLVVFILIASILYFNNKQKHKTNKLLEQTLRDLKSTQSQLIQSEKMASLGELTAGIAHEIQNPLNFVNNFSEVSRELLEELRSEKSKGKSEKDSEIENEILNDVALNLEKILHHGKRADAIVKGMLQHSRGSTGDKVLTDLNALADEWLRLAYHGLRGKDNTINVSIKTDFDPAVTSIRLIPQDIGRVLLNIYSNAFYAANERKKADGKDFIPLVEVRTLNKEDGVEICVRDNGDGIPEKHIDKIFQPFFTTKPTGQGTGLGLSLSYDIIKSIGGDLSVKSQPGEGAEFIITLPIA